MPQINLSRRRFLESFCLCAVILASSLLLQHEAMAWAPKKAPLMTKWASEVKPDNVLPEYPRPLLARKDWLNLNGVWEYQAGTANEKAPVGRKLSGEILVPFAVESALSGVMEHHEHLWYRRSFTVPSKWAGKQILLNFGAVDYESEVLVNGKSVGVHKGGYLPFSYNITPYLKGKGPQELIVRVFDPTDNEGQPRGKQTTTPRGIMYTPTTGIWQTVWLEPVAQTSIRNLVIDPNIDNQTVQLKVNTTPSDTKTKVVVKVFDSGRLIKTQESQPNTSLSIPIPNVKLWSPDSPFLYDLSVELVQNGKTVDKVASYFGMRKISLGEENGVKKIFLNNKFVFQMGPLDQGFWPDGLYTAPTDEALRYDIEMTKKFGFNMTRKHIKVEPARWYYWTDKLGLLVWQDMPSANSYNRNNKVKPAIDTAEYEKQLRELVETHRNIPSIVMWIVFNEKQGRHNTAQLVNMVKTLDPSRLVNRDSGGGFETIESDVGDIDDVHAYPAPASPRPSATQALACGEYGGTAYLVKGHAWQGNNWGYTSVGSAKDLEVRYAEFMALNNQFRLENGMSGAVYTQITDVEGEINGLLTYDRLIKTDPAKIALANRFQYPLPIYNAIVPTSEKEPQIWEYTTDKPADDWSKKQFDDSNWRQGTGGFGTPVPGSPRIGTPWATSDIWIRRTFDLGALTIEQISNLVVKNYHDENVEVFINGVLATSASGFTSAYEYSPLSLEARQSLVLGGENTLAIHCNQTRGGQYIDAGIYERQMPK